MWLTSSELPLGGPCCAHPPPLGTESPRFYFLSFLAF